MCDSSLVGSIKFFVKYLVRNDHPLIISWFPLDDFFLCVNQIFLMTCSVVVYVLFLNLLAMCSGIYVYAELLKVNFLKFSRQLLSSVTPFWLGFLNFSPFPTIRFHVPLHRNSYQLYLRLSPVCSVLIFVQLMFNISITWKKMQCISAGEAI